MPKKLTTLFPSYFPSVSWWQKMTSSDVVIILDSQPFSSRSGMNRTWIKTKEGRKNLTVPVLRQEHQSTAAREIKIDPISNWSRTHKASLVSNYRNTPYFEHYFPHFEEFYSQQWKTLIECNVAGIKLINGLLRWETRIYFSSEIPTSGSREERVIQLLEKFDCDCYVIESNSEAFFRTQILEERGYDVECIGPFKIEYEQQFEEFCFDLSVIDVIFNEGPYAVNLLKSSEVSKLSSAELAENGR